MRRARVVAGTAAGRHRRPQFTGETSTRLLHRLAGFCVRYRGQVILAWLLLVAVLVGANTVAGGSFVNDLSVSGTDSQAARDTMRLWMPEQSGDPMQIVIQAAQGITAPQVRGATEAALADIRSGPDVAMVQSPYGPGATVSDDGTTAIVTVVFDQTARDIPPVSVEAVQAATAPIRDAGADVEFGGPAAAPEAGPSGSEVVGLVAAVIVLLVAFGSLYAMVVPILTAVFALALGLSVLGLLAAWMPVGTAAPVVAAMIGLGVGIDYALLIVTRHREGLAAGRTPTESIATAVATPDARLSSPRRR